MANSYPKTRRKAIRPKSSYRAKSPEARERQLANLRKGRSSTERKPRLINKSGEIPYERLAGMTIIEFCEIALGISFEGRVGQRCILKSIYGERLDAAEREIYTKITGNTKVFEENVPKCSALLCLGGRSGKSFLSSAVILKESLQDKWKQYKAKDEVSYGVIIACRLEQARQIIGANCARLVENSRVAYMVEDSWSTALKLKNHATIASFPANAYGARGYAIHALAYDEQAHMSSGDSPKADRLIYDALILRTSQFPGMKILQISTPASKSGLFFETLDEGFTVPGRFTCQAPTWEINRKIPQDFFEREKKRDYDNYLREVCAIPAEQVDQYLPYDKIVDSLVLPDDLPPDSRYRYYLAVDQSGIAGKDAWGTAVAHREGDVIVCDLLRSWHTKDGKRIMADLKQIARDYNCHTVYGDKYSGGWVAQALSDVNLELVYRERLPQIYQAFKSKMLQGNLRLPNTKDLKDGLVRTVAYFSERSSTFSIGHPRDSSGHSDSADACVTACYYAGSQTTDGYFGDEIEYQRSLGARL